MKTQELRMVRTDFDEGLNPTEKDVLTQYIVCNM
jgi:hypothetical protein